MPPSPCQSHVLCSRAVQRLRGGGRRAGDRARGRAAGGRRSISSRTQGAPLVPPPPRAVKAAPRRQPRPVELSDARSRLPRSVGSAPRAQGAPGVAARVRPAGRGPPHGAMPLPCIWTQDVRDASGAVQARDPGRLRPVFARSTPPPRRRPPHAGGRRAAAAGAHMGHQLDDDCAGAAVQVQQAGARRGRARGRGSHPPPGAAAWVRRRAGARPREGAARRARAAARRRPAVPAGHTPDPRRAPPAPLDALPPAAQCRRRWVALKSVSGMRKGPWTKHVRPRAGLSV
jgi:hypothetical protein